MQSSSNANTNLALAGGLLTGILASACCVGPLLLLILGIGGAWIGHLIALEPYRPIFIALTFLLLGLAFRKLYVDPQTCASEENCVADRTRRVQKILFWSFAPISLASVASPWILCLFYR